MSHTRFNTRSALAMLTMTAVVTVSAVALVGKPEPVQAFPAYSQKEGIKCAYCHISAAGGGKRNYRGKFYKKNGLSFASFDDKAEADAAGEPIAPDAEEKPKSLTAPGAPTATPTPAAATPAPVATPAPTEPSVAELRKKAAVTELALKKAPKNATAKKAHSASLTTLARGIMNDATIPPASKYPEALKLLRQAVTLDPSNKGAATDVQRIVDVYKQMGKPVPK